MFAMSSNEAVASFLEYSGVTALDVFEDRVGEIQEGNVSKGDKMGGQEGWQRTGQETLEDKWKKETISCRHTLTQCWIATISGRGNESHACLCLQPDRSGLCCSLCPLSFFPACCSHATPPPPPHPTYTHMNDCNFLRLSASSQSGV